MGFSVYFVFYWCFRRYVLTTTVAVVDTFVFSGWFYKGYKSGKIHEALKEEIKTHAALAPEEVEEVRTSNNLLISHFEALVVRVRARYPTRKADPNEFFEFCGKALGK